MVSTAKIELDAREMYYVRVATALQKVWVWPMKVHLFNIKAALVGGLVISIIFCLIALFRALAEVDLTPERLGIFIVGVLVMAIPFVGLYYLLICVIYGILNIVMSIADIFARLSS